MARPAAHPACLLFVLFVLFGCATPAAPPARFVDETLGIASDFSPEWTIATDRESAPPAMRDQFPAEKGPDDPLLLLAVRGTGDAFARVWAEPVPRSWSAVDYLAYLQRSVGSRLEFYEASRADDFGAVRIRYRDKSIPADITYVETITVRNGYGVRFGFSSLTSLAPVYREEFDRIADAWLFRDESTHAWLARWAGMTQSLTSEGLDFIELADASNSETCGPGERQLLWEVPSRDGSLYLFGSVHLGDPSNYPLPDAIESAFARSQSLIVEFDITSPPVQREIADLMQKLSPLPPGETIRDHLSAGGYRKLEAAFDDLGIPMRNFVGLKPWSLATVLSVLKLQTLGYLDRYGVDRYFLERAGSREIVSIESPDEQLRLLDSLDGELYLAYTLIGLSSAERLSHDMMRAWRCGDEAGLEELFVESPSSALPGMENVMQAMYYDRNERMADFAAKQLAKPGHHFLVVGIAHMLGDHGIPALLRAKGYTVERR